MGSITRTSGSNQLVTRPVGVRLFKKFKVKSGGSGGTWTPGVGGSSGGGGGYAEYTNYLMTDGNRLFVNVGVGSAGASNGATNPGDVSWWFEEGVAQIVHAEGATGCDGLGNPGQGGFGTVGTSTVTGGNGKIAVAGNGGPGGGGCADGTVVASDGDPAAGPVGGAGGTGDGPGGTGGDVDTDGLPGTYPGGGGGGGGDVVINPSSTGGAGQGGWAYAEWDDPPSDVSCVPAFGPIAGGIAVAILGNNFVNGATVDFGSGPLAATFINSSRLELTCPPGSVGPVTIRVENPNTNFGDGVGVFTFTQGTPTYAPFNRTKRRPGI